jgi:dipeptidyl aminopeptidase/acylaminoacyl peptidase
MGAIIKVLSPVALAASEGDIYTVSTGKNAVVKSIVLYNNATSEQAVTLFAIPSGNNSSLASQIYGDNLTTKETKVINPDIFLSPGDKIRGYAASANNVSCRVSALEVS